MCVGGGGARCNVACKIYAQLRVKYMLSCVVLSLCVADLHVFAGE